MNLVDPSGHVSKPPTNQECGPDGQDCGSATTDTPTDSDTDGDGIPDMPDPDQDVSIGTSMGCGSDSYVECFYLRELLVIDGELDIDSDQFNFLVIAIFYDIRNRDRSASDRMRYDTPFWDYKGEAPGQVCFGGNCYERHEVNYIAQGMWSAAENERLAIGQGIVVGWKITNFITNIGSGTYPSPIPSEGTLYWFNVGYQAYNILNQNYEGIIDDYP